MCYKCNTQRLSCFFALNWDVSTNQSQHSKCTRWVGGKKPKRTQQFWEVDKYGVSSAIFYFARSSHSYIVQCAQLETQYTTVSKYLENLLFVPSYLQDRYLGTSSYAYFMQWNVNAVYTSNNCVSLWLGMQCITPKPRHKAGRANVNMLVQVFTEAPPPPPHIPKYRLIL